MNQANLSLNRNRPPAQILMWGVGILVIGFVLLQMIRLVIPEFQPDNPPVTQNVVWNSPEAEQLWDQACADCHSNETIYPWYAYVAPVGWLVAHDTHEGRDALNVSENRRIEWGEMIEVIEKGEMPLPIYITMHPEANLSGAQRETLIAGIKATFR